MKINVTITKDKRNHKNFLVFVPQHAVKTTEKILEQMEKHTGVPWKINMKHTDTRYLAVETGDLTQYWKLKELSEGLDEHCFVNWRMKWKNQIIEIATGK